MPDRKRKIYLSVSVMVLAGTNRRHNMTLVNVCTCLLLFFTVVFGRRDFLYQGHSQSSSIYSLEPCLSIAESVNVIWPASVSLKVVTHSGAFHTVLSLLSAYDPWDFRACTRGDHRLHCTLLSNRSGTAPGHSKALTNWNKQSHHQPKLTLSTPPNCELHTTRFCFLLLPPSPLHCP